MMSLLSGPGWSVFLVRYGCRNLEKTFVFWIEVRRVKARQAVAPAHLRITPAFQ